MTALQLALAAKRHGVRFEYFNGRISMRNLSRLPPDLAEQVRQRLNDVLAVVAEHNHPCELRATDVVDIARRIASKFASTDYAAVERA